MVMKINKNKIERITSSIILALVIVLAYYYLPLPQYQDTIQSQTYDASITWNSYLTISIKRAGTDKWVTLFERKHNVLTTIGKNFIESELGDIGTSSTAVARYISLSESATSPTTAWTILPSEIATGGLTRAEGTYTSLGDGYWRLVKIFTASSGFTVRCAGANWASSGDNNLLCAVAFGTVATLASGDTLNATWIFTIAEV